MYLAVGDIYSFQANASHGTLVTVTFVFDNRTEGTTTIKKRHMSESAVIVNYTFIGYVE